MYPWGLSWRTRVVNNNVYHFVGSNLGMEIFEKEGTSEQECVEIEDWGTSAHFVLRFHENSSQSVYAFLLFFGNKKNSKSSILFHSLIIEFLWFA